MGGAVAILLHKKHPKYRNGAVLVAPMCKLLRENKRMIDGSIREIERERQGWKLKKEFLLDGGYALVCGAKENQDLPPNFIRLAKDVYTPDMIAASDCMIVPQIFSSLKCYHVLVMPFCNAYGVGLTDFLLVILANNGGVLAGLAACGVTMDIIATVASDLMRDFKTSSCLTLASPMSMFVRQVIGEFAMGVSYPHVSALDLHQGLQRNRYERGSFSSLAILNNAVRDSLRKKVGKVYKVKAVHMVCDRIGSCFALKVLEKEKLQENAFVVGSYMKERLTSLKEKYERNVRGRGLMLGVELVLDRHLKTHCQNRNPSCHGADERCRGAHRKRRILWQCVRITPPLYFTKEDAR
ncbi:hypothetical protein Syun_030678 [Stephania yunnanensis]|uniref:Uncharacterized protein n=1 Tax=Stephania yunnanensis TaxID=152371 RepID=A0AAP0HAD9_9MAGN